MLTTEVIEKANELIAELQELVRAAYANQDVYHKVEYCLSICQDIDNLAFGTGGDNE
jgi:hypothetical protein